MNRKRAGNNWNKFGKTNDVFLLATMQKKFIERLLLLIKLNVIVEIEFPTFNR